MTHPKQQETKNGDDTFVLQHIAEMSTAAAKPLGLTPLFIFAVFHVPLCR